MFCKFLHLHRFKSGRTSDNRGFSFVELAVVIAIAGIISAIAYPPMMQSRNNARTRGTAADIFASFRLAKTEAVKRNVTVCLEFRAAGTYMAFLDNGASPNDCIQDADETELFSKTVEPGTSIVADFDAGYTPRGRPWNNNIGNVVVQNDNNPNLQYRNNLSIAGRVDIEVTQNGSF